MPTVLRVTSHDGLQERGLAMTTIKRIIELILYSAASRTVGYVFNIAAASLKVESGARQPVARVSNL